MNLEEENIEQIFMSLPLMNIPNGFPSRIWIEIETKQVNQEVNSLFNLCLINLWKSKRLKKCIKNHNYNDETYQDKLLLKLFNENQIEKINKYEIINPSCNFKYYIYKNCDANFIMYRLIYGDYYANKILDQEIEEEKCNLIKNNVNYTMYSFSSRTLLPIIVRLKKYFIKEKIKLYSSKINRLNIKITTQNEREIFNIFLCCLHKIGVNKKILCLKMDLKELLL